MEEFGRWDLPPELTAFREQQKMEKERVKCGHICVYVCVTYISARTQREGEMYHM
jgi:hypothetical protein